MSTDDKRAADLCATSGCEHPRDEHDETGYCGVRGNRPRAANPFHADDCLRFSEPVPVSDETNARTRQINGDSLSDTEKESLRPVSDVHSTNDPEPWGPEKLIGLKEAVRRALDDPWTVGLDSDTKAAQIVMVIAAELRVAGIVPRSDDEQEKP